MRPSWGSPCADLAVPGAADDLVVGWVDAAPTLLLNAHLDTVEPSWPWSGVAELREDRIHGLGAIDDKGGVVACLLAFVLARDAGVPLASGGVALGFTVDEEKGGSGSLVMADVLQPRRVVVAEGTDLQIGASEAGCVEVWLRTRGVAVHGALREEGVNAAEAAVKMVGELLDLPMTRDAHPRHGANVPMLWQIHAGSPLNVVPDLRGGADRHPRRAGVERARGPCGRRGDGRAPRRRRGGRGGGGTVRDGDRRSVGHRPAVGLGARDWERRPRSAGCRRGPTRTISWNAADPRRWCSGPGICATRIARTSRSGSTTW